jgi:hypothetical protein
LHHRSDHGPTDKTNPEIQTGKELQKIQSDAPVNKKRQRKELVLASIGTGAPNQQQQKWKFHKIT